MKQARGRKRISRDRISTEDLLFLEELKAHLGLLRLEAMAFGMSRLITQKRLDDVDSLLQRLKIHQASSAPQELTKKFFLDTADLMAKLLEKNGFGSRRACDGAESIKLACQYIANDISE